MLRWRQIRAEEEFARRAVEEEKQPDFIFTGLDAVFGTAVVAPHATSESVIRPQLLLKASPSAAGGRGKEANCCRSFGKPCSEMHPVVCLYVAVQRLLQCFVGVYMVDTRTSNIT